MQRRRAGPLNGEGVVILRRRPECGGKLQDGTGKLGSALRGDRKVGRIFRRGPESVRDMLQNSPQGFVMNFFLLLD